MTDSSGQKPPQEQSSSSPRPIGNIADPARRPDVLLRQRHPDGHEISAWWMVGAFLFVSAVIIAVMGFVPGGA